MGIWKHFTNTPEPPIQLEMITLGEPAYYSCTQCNSGFRVKAQQRKGGDIQINITSFCEHLEFAYVRIGFNVKQQEGEV